MKPLTIRKTAAIAGAAKASPSSLRNKAPATTAGMVARTTWKNVLLSFATRLPEAPARESPKLSQSRQKKAKSAIEVPKCMTAR